MTGSLSAGKNLACIESICVISDGASFPPIYFLTMQQLVHTFNIADLIKKLIIIIKKTFNTLLFVFFAIIYVCNTFAAINYLFYYFGLEHCTLDFCHDFCQTMTTGHCL